MYTRGMGQTCTPPFYAQNLPGSNQPAPNPSITCPTGTSLFIGEANDTCAYFGCLTPAQITANNNAMTTLQCTQSLQTNPLLIAGIVGMALLFVLPGALKLLALPAAVVAALFNPLNPSGDIMQPVVNAAGQVVCGPSAAGTRD